MANFSTEGIIVKKNNFGEADRVLVIITPFHGKIRVLAKGVRKITSRRNGSIELINQARFALFKGQSFNILTEVQGIESFAFIKQDLILSSYALHAIEIAERLLPEGQFNPEVYYLLAGILDFLNEAATSLEKKQIFLRSYEIKLLSILGFWSTDQVQTNTRLKQILNLLEKKSWEDIKQISFDLREVVEIGKILRYYLERILESQLKTVRVMDTMKGL